MSFSDRWPVPQHRAEIQVLERKLADAQSYLRETIKAYEAQSYRITELEALLKRLEDQAWHTRWNRGR